MKNQYLKNLNKIEFVVTYTCTDEILAGLGQMYAADERFKKNIDKYGDGTAEFAKEGIRVYVENQ